MDKFVSGRHLIVTGLCAESAREKLNDHLYLESLMNQSIRLVNMDVLIPAQTIQVPLDESKTLTDEDCGGITGFAVLSTSHVSIHTWPLSLRVSFDIYSCHDFDDNVVQKFLIHQLDMVGGDFLSIERKPLDFFCHRTF